MHCSGSWLACASIWARFINRSFGFYTILRRFGGFAWSKSTFKRSISQSCKATSIAILSNAQAAFWTDIRNAGELLFLASKWTKLRPHRGVKIFKVEGCESIGGFGITTHQEPNGLSIFLVLKYNNKQKSIYDHFLQVMCPVSAMVMKTSRTSHVFAKIAPKKGRNSHRILLYWTRVLDLRNQSRISLDL